MSGGCWFDTDHCVRGEHQANFIATIKEADRKGVKVALSRPCFEIWLLLHHTEETNVRGHANCQEVENALKLILDSYNKTKLRSEHFQRSQVDEAFQRAERLDLQVVGGDIPASNTTRIYKLWRAITNK